MAKKQKPRIKVGVLMGGPSSEHDVSLATGWNVLENLDRSKYEPFGIKITKEKEWIMRGRVAAEEKILQNCDIVFNALHGTFGEDGKIQAFLEYHGKRYTGSGIAASALAMDKLRSREIFNLAGMQVPKTLKIRSGENYQALLGVFTGKIAGFPVVVKPCSNGSSFGVAIAKNPAELAKAIKTAFRIDKKVLVEEFINGTEVTCGVLDPAPPVSELNPMSGAGTLNVGHIAALPVTEIVPKKSRKFFDYSAKYKGFSSEITPARIDADIATKVQEIAIKTHQILGCRNYSRTDMIIRNGDIYVLEINTLPGLTKASLLPKAVMAAGLSFPELLDNIISDSLA